MALQVYNNTLFNLKTCIPKRRSSGDEALMAFFHLTAALLRRPWQNCFWVCWDNVSIPGLSESKKTWRFPVAAVPHEHVSKHATFEDVSKLWFGLFGYAFFQSNPCWGKGWLENAKAKCFIYHIGTKMMVCAANALPRPHLAKNLASIQYWRVR